jgi:uncharacterized protein with PQ loop repeat
MYGPKNKRKNMSEKTINAIGWFASIMAILMFSSYIDQIRLNLSGRPGSVILPIATTINCLAWVAYALLKQKKDWPIFFCNALGAFLGFITAVTAIIVF